MLQTDLKNTQIKSTACVFFFFFLQVMVSQIPLFPGSSSRRRVNPRAASGGGAWRRHAATFF
jgi:hypothetical protein